MSLESQGGLDALHDIRRRMEAAENAGDAEAIASLFADDAVLMVPTFPVQEGAEACAGFIRDLLPGLLAHFDRRISYTSAEVRIDGDRAFDRGLFAFTATPRAGGATNHETGKYLWLYVRPPDGGWKLSRAIMSLDEPERDATHAGLDAPAWRDRAGQLSASLALPFALFLGGAEVVRNWGAWGPWPFWVVDYIAVALLLLAWQAHRAGWPQARTLRAGAWGFTCAMLYQSFFSHLMTIDQPDPGPVPHAPLTAIVGVLFGLAAVGFVASLAAPSRE